MKSRSIYTCEQGIMYSCMHIPNHIQAANPCSLAPLGMPWNDPITQFDLKDFDSEKIIPLWYKNISTILTSQHQDLPTTHFWAYAASWRGPDTYTDPGRQSRNCSAVSSPIWIGRGSPGKFWHWCDPEISGPILNCWMCFIEISELNMLMMYWTGVWMEATYPCFRLES